jgi:fatty acid desaturase
VIPFFWERWFFAPHNMNYHIEHHLYPSVPSYRLPALSRALMANPEFAATAHVTHGFVTGLWGEIVGAKARRAARRAGTAVHAAE